jgi:hypothetical protein
MSALEWTTTSVLPHLPTTSMLPYVSCGLKTDKKQWEERVHTRSGKLEKGNQIDALTGLWYLRLPPHISEVPIWIGGLTTLTELHMAYCENIAEIPSFVGALKCLVTMNCAGCKGLISLPWSLGELSNLTTLNLAYCKRLERLPGSLSRLRRLVEMNLSACASLKTPPPEVVQSDQPC